MYRSWHPLRSATCAGVSGPAPAMAFQIPSWSPSRWSGTPTPAPSSVTIFPMNASNLASSIAIAALLCREGVGPHPRGARWTPDPRLAGGVVGHAPAHLGPRLVGAERPGADRRLQMGAELRVGGGDALDGVADACRDRLSSPLVRVAEGAGPPTESECGGQFVGNGVAFAFDACDAAGVVGGLGLGQCVVELGQALSELEAGSIVEHGVRSARVDGQA